MASQPIRIPAGQIRIIILDANFRRISMAKDSAARIVAIPYDSPGGGPGEKMDITIIQPAGTAIVDCKAIDFIRRHRQHDPLVSFAIMGLSAYEKDNVIGSAIFGDDEESIEALLNPEPCPEVWYDDTGKDDARYADTGQLIRPSVAG